MRKRTSTPGIFDTPKHAVATSASGGLSRRHFCQASAVGLMAGAIATGTLTGPALAAAVQSSGSGRGSLRGRRILLKDGVVLSLDPQVGDFENEHRGILRRISESLACHCRTGWRAFVR